MDKEVGALLQRVKQANRPPFWQSTPQAARASPTLMRLLFGGAPSINRVQDMLLPSKDGAEIQARLYVPTSNPSGLIVFFHGGGWVIGSVEDYHPFTADLALRTGLAVLSVDYRLAPEHPFPIPVQDAVAAISFAAKYASEWLGAAPQFLVAMGDSAGATLATVGARLHNKRGEGPSIDLQILAYPVTGSSFDTASYREFAQGYLLTRKDMEWFWQQYCPDLAQRLHPDASPLQIQDLTGSPPALILTAGWDPLRDEGEQYGHKLVAAGVPTEMVRCDGLVHGFLAMVNYAPSARYAYGVITKTLAEYVSGKKRAINQF